VNLCPSPNNPQQEDAATAAVTWDDITWNMEDQFLFQRSGVESRDPKVIQEIGNPHETEDFGRTWEELMGISEDIPEIDGLTE